MGFNSALKGLMYVLVQSSHVKHFANKKYYLWMYLSDNSTSMYVINKWSPLTNRNNCVSILQR